MGTIQYLVHAGSFEPVYHASSPMPCVLHAFMHKQIGKREFRSVGSMPLGKINVAGRKGPIPT